MRNQGNGFEYGPKRPLALLYKKLGRAGESRDLLLAAARSPGDFSNSDPSYAAYQKINQSMSVGSMLLELGYPADSARIYSEVANDTQALEAAKASVSAAGRTSSAP